MCYIGGKSPVLICRYYKISGLFDIAFAFIPMTLFEIWRTGYYYMPIKFNLIHYSEGDSIVIFFCEYVVFMLGGWFIVFFLSFDFSFFFLFTNYVVGQLELISHYITQLNLKDTKMLEKSLAEIITVHLDTLQ